jgi:hypothetical protein
MTQIQGEQVADGRPGMLYEAVSHPKADKLEVTNTSTSSSGYRNPLVTKKYNKQRFDYIDLPLYSLLGRFGNLIPEAGIFHTQEPGFSGARSTEVIMVSVSLFQHTPTSSRVED